MLTSISSLRRSNSTRSGSTRSTGISDPPGDAVVVARRAIILAQRIADPILRQEDPSQIGVTDEVDADQVEYLALVPIGRLPDRAQGRHLGQAARNIVL